MGDKSALFVTTVPITLTSFLLPLAARLREHCWRVECLSAGAADDNPVATTANPQLRVAFDRCHDIAWSRSPLSMLRYPSFARRVREVVNEGRFDIVHVHTPIAAFITRAALRGDRDGSPPRPRLIYTVHGFHFRADGPNGLSAKVYRLAERIAARWTDDLVVLTEEDRLSAMRITKGTRCRVNFIEGVGMDFDGFARAIATGDPDDVRRRLGLSVGDFVVTMIAEMNDNKRHRLLIDAVGLVRELIPSLRVILVGDGPLRAELEAHVARSGLSDVVTVTGTIPPADLPGITGITDVGVLVSRREGLPRSLMELIAGGATIAGTRTRGIVDEVLDDRAIAVTDDAQGVADVLLRLYSDEDLRTRLGAAQLAHARAHYSMDVILDGYEALYETSEH